MHAGSDIESRRTSTSTMPCIYSSASKPSLQKRQFLSVRLATFGSLKARKRRNPRLSTIKKTGHSGSMECEVFRVTYVA